MAAGCIFDTVFFIDSNKEKMLQKRTNRFVHFSMKMYRTIYAHFGLAVFKRFKIGNFSLMDK